MCFFLFLTGVASANPTLPPGKFIGFSINECNSDVCYTIAGPRGYTSKLGDIFSSEKTSIITFNKKSSEKKEYFCEEFKLEVSDKIGTCLNSKTSQASEFNFSMNQIKTLKML